MKKNQSSRKKLPNTWRKSDTVWAILAFICVVIMIWGNVFHVSASNQQNAYNLPYYVDYYRGSYFDSININSNLLNTLNNQGFWWFGDIIYSDNNQAKAYVYYPLANNPFTISYKNHDLNANVVYNDVNFASDFICLTGTFVRYTIALDKRTGVWSDAYVTPTTQRNVTINLCGRDSTAKNAYGFTPNVPYYLAENLEYTDSNNNLVFTNGAPVIPGPEVNTGHATEPDFDTDNNINTDGHAEQPNDPQFPQFPTIVIDTTNVESLLESIFEAVTAMGDFVGQCFSTFFAWLVDVIKNAIQAIINTIREVATFLYNNFVSLFEPMMENVGHAVEPVQNDEIVQAFEDTGIYQDFSSMTDLVNDSFDVFDDISEPQTFRIPIHLENIQMLNCGVQYIDLGWFDSAKTALRAFMWCVTTFGLLYTIIDALPSYISGGDE